MKIKEKKEAENDDAKEEEDAKKKDGEGEGEAEGIEMAEVNESNAQLGTASGPSSNKNAIAPETPLLKDKES